MTLTEDSEVNLISYEALGDWIEASVRDLRFGIFNLSAKQNTMISDIAKLYRKNPVWGNYKYKAPILNNTKSKSVLDLSKSMFPGNLSQPL